MPFAKALLLFVAAGVGEALPPRPAPAALPSYRIVLAFPAAGGQRFSASPFRGAVSTPAHAAIFASSHAGAADSPFASARPSEVDNRADAQVRPAAAAAAAAAAATADLQQPVGGPPLGHAPHAPRADHLHRPPSPEQSSPVDFANRPDQSHVITKEVQIQPFPYSRSAATDYEISQQQQRELGETLPQVRLTDYGPFPTSRLAARSDNLRLAYIDPSQNSQQQTQERHRQNKCIALQTADRYTPNLDGLPGTAYQQAHALALSSKHTSFSEQEQYQSHRIDVENHGYNYM